MCRSGVCVYVRVYTALSWLSFFNLFMYFISFTKLFSFYILKYCIFFICINWCCLKKLLEGLNKITNVETFCKLLTCAFSKEFNHTCYASFFFYLIVKYHTLEMYNVLWHIKEFEKWTLEICLTQCFTNRLQNPPFFYSH